MTDSITVEELDDLARQWSHDKFMLRALSAARRGIEAETLQGSLKLAVEAWDAARPGWRPIETAPNVVGYYLVWVGEAIFAYRCRHGKWWENGERISPTHWMPPPPPPTDRQENDDELARVENVERDLGSRQAAMVEPVAPLPRGKAAESMAQRAFDKHKHVLDEAPPIEPFYHCPNCDCFFDKNGMIPSPKYSPPDLALGGAQTLYTRVAPDLQPDAYIVLSAPRGYMSPELQAAIDKARRNKPSPDLAGVKERLKGDIPQRHVESGYFEDDRDATKKLIRQALRVIEGLESERDYWQRLMSHDEETVRELLHDANCDLTAAQARCEELEHALEAQERQSVSAVFHFTEVERLTTRNRVLVEALEKIASITKDATVERIARAALTTERDG